MEVPDLTPIKDPKGGSLSKTPTPLPIRKARFESEMSETQKDVMSDIKSEWRWRGQTEEQIKELQRTATQTRDGIEKLSVKIENLQLTVQAQVTKMVIISGILVWVGSVITSAIFGYILKLMR